MKNHFKTILAGRGRGIPFFLAWCLGPFAAFCAIFYSTRIGERPIGSLISLLLLSIWQAFLLFSTWRRRIGWVLIYIAIGSGFDPTASTKTIVWTAACSAAIVQSFLFLGVRKRFWLWIAVAIISHPSVNVLYRSLQDFYNLPIRYLFRMPQWMWTILPRGFPQGWWPAFSQVYYLLMGIVFGYVVAIFMPPVQPASAATPPSDEPNSQRPATAE